jgi:hypothetical protein
MGKSQEHMGNHRKLTCQWEKTRDTYGKIIGKCGKIMGKWTCKGEISWENHGRIVGNIWKYGNVPHTLW